MTLEPLYSVADVAAYLRVSPRTVRRIMADGKLAFLPQRGGRRISEAAIRRYVAGAEIVARRRAA